MQATGGPDSLQDLFGARLYGAAQQIIATGQVLDVRILQGGAIVTGIVGAGASVKHRVYIRRANGGLQVEGECSCSERNPCIHIAAVTIAAGSRDQAVSEGIPRGGKADTTQQLSRPTAPTAPGTSTERQRLHYTLEPANPIRVSVWVGQSTATLQPFTLRSISGGTDFPRYVEPHDKDVLKALANLGIEGPWELTGSVTNALLEAILATGRAYWRAVGSRPLRPGPVRRPDFAWEALPDGNQQLRCQGSAHVLLTLEPPLYVDPVSMEWGTIAPGYPLDLLRRYSQLAPVTPDRAPAINEEISATRTDLPRLRIFQVAKQALSSLTPRLLLEGGPEAKLCFIYNGIPVDSGRLQDDDVAVRQLMDGVLYEIPRDHDLERSLRERLDMVRPSADAQRESWLGFMLDAVPALREERWEIAVAPDFPYTVTKADDWYGELDTSARQGWFNLRLGVTVDGRQVNLLPALTHYLQITLAGGQTSLITNAFASAANEGGCRVGEQWLIRLDDGRYLPIAIERIQRIANTLVELFDRDGLTNQRALALPVSHTGRIAQLARELGGPSLTANDAALKALLDDLKSSGGIPPQSAPPHFQATLRPYQQEGLGWLQFLRRHHLGGILADDMGLGKTVQTLAHLACEKAARRLSKPALIVAPVSTLGNWQNELHRFAPELTGLVLHGSRRRESFSLIGKVDIIITAYPLLLLDSETLLAHDYSLVILDEAQTIKNPRAKVSAMARALRAEHRLALTGTPVENHLGELWSLFDFVQPGLLGDERHFQRHYRTPIEKEGNRLRAQALAQRLAPFLLRRTKDAVAADLPAKTEIIETLALDERQRDFYDGIRLASHRHIQEVIRLQGLARSQITILDALLKLRQACCDPRLLEVGVTQDGTGGIPSAKLDWLSSALPELIAEGRRVLLFSQFTSMLRIIESTVTQLGIPYTLLTGDTRNRPEVIARFQSGAVPLFLISLKAGGTGLNLTAADTVIHYDPWWNPAVEAQATDRAHRIGQDKPVFVYKLIAQGTVEERILQLQADKHALASRLFTATSGTLASWTPSDIEALFAP